jgi:DNA-binding NtrC family response regulator
MNSNPDKRDLTTATQSFGSDANLQIEPISIVATEGPSTGRSLLLASGTAIVGRSRRCSLHLDDPSLSGQHLSLELVRGGVRLRDLGSKNGSYFLGARFEVINVPAGTTVKLGQTKLQLRPKLDGRLSEHRELHGLVSESVAMRQLLWRIERAAPAIATIVIRGPTGSGKSLVANVIHQLSGRGAKPFEVFDCAGANAELLESDLFGHEKGAFTGAHASRMGVIERAHTGTLVLDNVDQLPMLLQTRLLRFLEEKTMQRVGGLAPRAVDVRVIATTQAGLEKAVEEGHMRADIFFRLSTVILDVPSLADRIDDIPRLVEILAAEHENPQGALTPSTLAAFQAHPWTGNVRELKNAVARTLAMNRFDVGDDEPREPAARDEGLYAARAQVSSAFEGDALRALLKKHSWNISAVAREAKIARSHLYTLIAKYKLRRDA